jgi:hypothetical protein
MTSIDKAKLILSSFPGRDDCYGSGACIKKPLTEAVILRHVLGKERIGRYLLRQDGMTGVLAVDIDENNLNTAIEYREQCKRNGLTAYVERSRSGNYHVWWFFAGTVPARKARLTANYILSECHMPKGTELFPKQDFIEPGRYGNYINLPEFGRDVGQGRTVFLDPSAGYQPYRDQWAFLASRATINETQLDEIVGSDELYEQTHKAIKSQGFDLKDNDSCKGTGLPCFSRMMREGVDKGMRNEATLRLSVQIFRAGIPQDLCLLMLLEWNKRNRPPLDDAELEKAVSNGYLGVYGHGCCSRLIQRYCDPSCPIFQRHSQNDDKPYKR